LKEDGEHVSLGFWKNASSRRRRIITILLVFVVMVILTALAMLTPMSKQEATTTNNDLNQTVNDLSTSGSLLQYIYGNNFMITMIMFVPFVGALFGFYVLYNTGVTLEAEGIAQNVPPILVLISVFLTPVGWLEFVAYSTAIAASIWLSARIVQNRGRHELSNTAKFISVCAAILLVSAIIEVILIQVVA
jgi:hypothetical protein